MKKTVLLLVCSMMFISSCGEDTRPIAKTELIRDGEKPVVADISPQAPQTKPQASAETASAENEETSERFAEEPEVQIDLADIDDIAAQYTNNTESAEPLEEDIGENISEELSDNANDLIDEADFITPSEEDITDIDRKYLHENAYDYEGKWVRIAGTVQGISERDDGTYSVAFSGPSAVRNIYCYMLAGQEKLVTDGEFATVVGRVGSKLIGQLVMENCYVENTGKEAESFNDKMISSAPSSTKEEPSVKDSDGAKKTVSYDYVEYTANDYESILRNPDSYNDKPIKLSGTVSQVIEGWLWSDSIIIEDSAGNRWIVNYHYDDGESHVLEGDHVTVYGTLNGTARATTLLGKQVVTPYIKGTKIG